MLGFSRRRLSHYDSGGGARKDIAPMDQPLPNAELLQDIAEKWQELATKQQDVAQRLEELASTQHALTNLWVETRDQDLGAEARQLEQTLRELTRLALHIEAQALEKIERTVIAEVSSLRSN
jgi:23S rRNA C2498 (ribose-2'-O)-methylase RlmM